MNSWMAWVWIAALLAVFYFLLIRPQQKRSKEHQRLISDVKVGDEVVTIGGLCGKVRGISDETVFLEVDKGVRVKITKSAISRRLVEEEEEKKKAKSGGEGSNKE